MSNHKNTPSVTEKYHIEVPLHEYYSGYCVYKVWFKKHFYIGKGKQLLQSAQLMATSIERELRFGRNDDGAMYHKVLSYIKKAKVMRAWIEVVGGDGLSEFELLKLEQETLDKHKDDPKCLNNNLDAYIPKWIQPTEVQKFFQWRGISQDDALRKIEATKKKSLFSIIFFNDLDKNRLGVYKVFFGEHYYIGSTTSLYGRMLTHGREIRKRLSGAKAMNEFDMYEKIITLIKKDKLQVATCVLVSECKTADQMTKMEQAELNRAKDDPKCLNVGYNATKRPANEDLAKNKKKYITVFKNGKLNYFTANKKKK